jgi:hypothetical protein
VSAGEREALRREYHLRDPRVAQVLDYLELVERRFFHQLRRTEEMEARLTRSVSAALDMHSRLRDGQPPRTPSQNGAAAPHEPRARSNPPAGRGAS